MKKAFAFVLVFVCFCCSLWAAVSESEVLISTGSGTNTIRDVVEDTDTLIDLELIFTSYFGAPTSGYNDAIIVDEPQHGSVGTNNSLKVTYRPDTNFFDSDLASPVDSFSFSFFDNTLDFPTYADPLWVYIDTIIGVNDVPKAMRDSFMVVQDSGAIYATVLKNDVDVDKAGLEVEVLANVNHGVLDFHPDVYQFNNDFLFFPNDSITPSNKNLVLPFDQMNMTYLDENVFVYKPALGFYGYDSMTYIIHEYRSASVAFFQKEEYRYVWNEDADTATVILYVEAHDYVPVVVDDIMKDGSTFMTESDSTVSISFYPMNNDIDPVSASPQDFLSLPYILKSKADSAIASSDNDTVVFEHKIAEYDSAKQMIVYHTDSNIAFIDDSGQLTYSYAAGYSGVDSLFYSVVEQPLLGNDYPSRYRGDTSALGVIYFVVTPTDDPTYAFSDTLDYSYSELRTIGRYDKMQLFDVLSNDLDAEVMSASTLSVMKRLMGDNYDSKIEMNISPSLQSDFSSIAIEVEASQGNIILSDGDAYYHYVPPYNNNNLLIDSFKYVLFSGEANETSAWAFIRHLAVDAKDDIKHPSNLNFDEEGNSTIHSSLSLLANDTGTDTLFVLFNNDGTLNSPSKSVYAELLESKNDDVDYYYHHGFTTVDSFQYIVSDFISKDTAWVTIINSACEAINDMVTLQVDFSKDDSYYEEIDVLINDVDEEDNKYIMPLTSEGDTLDTGHGLVVIENAASGATLNYHYKANFFHTDSFVYRLTDVPLYYSANNFFTQDTAWVYVVDDAFLLDTDKDGIRNAMENGIPGYQSGEDTLDFDGDGLPNYLDIDADGDGLRDAGDCDNDGILNFLDDDSGCDDIEVANLFTPNDDGVNDLFVIPDLLLSDGMAVPTRMRIYNRWGGLVYENTNYGKENDWWDGKLGDVPGVNIGDELPNGVYLYYMTYGNGKFKKEGFVHIQR